MAMKWFLVLISIVLIALGAILLLSDLFSAPKTNLIPNYIKLLPRSSIEIGLDDNCVRARNMSRKEKFFVPVSVTAIRDMTENNNKNLKVGSCD